MRSFVLPTIAFSALLFYGCARTPPRLQGDYVAIEPSQASTGKFNGTSVRWGGIVAGRRSTDAGECVEIATLEINPMTGVPLASATPDYLWPSTFRDRRGKSAPRFLACGMEDTISAHSTRFGTLLTVTGTIQPSLDFTVDRASCLQPVPGSLILPSRPDYSGTPHTLTEDACRLAMPILSARSTTSWRDPATSRLVGPRDYGKDLPMYRATSMVE